MHRVADIDAEILLAARQDGAGRCGGGSVTGAAGRRRRRVDRFLLVGAGRKAGKSGQKDDPEIACKCRHENLSPWKIERRESTARGSINTHGVMADHDYSHGYR